MESILDPRFLTVEDIARDLSIAEDTVRSWIREKKLPAYRVGREYRIMIVDYERFLQQRRTTHDAPPEKDWPHTHKIGRTQLLTNPHHSAIIMQDTYL